MIGGDGIKQFLISQFSEQGNVPTVLKTVVLIFFNGDLSYTIKFMWSLRYE